MGKAIHGAPPAPAPPCGGSVPTHAGALPLRSTAKAQPAAERAEGAASKAAGASEPTVTALGTPAQEDRDSVAGSSGAAAGGGRAAQDTGGRAPPRGAILRSHRPTCELGGGAGAPA